jgi:hypothetical protein
MAQAVHARSAAPSVRGVFNCTRRRARFLGHGACDDPDTRADAEPRERTEIRTIAFA